MKARFVWGLCLLFLCLSGCTLDNIAARQEKATGLWEELTGGKTFGQSFICTRNNLYRIDLSTATYARINTSPVIFHLRSASPSTSEGAETFVATDILTITLPGPEVQNDRPTSFVFPPLHDSKDKAFYFLIESPEGAPGNAITVYVNEYDQYLAGTAYRNGQPVAGDLAFTAYSQETFTFSGVIQDFLSRVTQDVPFFTCYCALLLLVCICLFLSLRHYPRQD
jgi:hypothetical protein